MSDIGPELAEEISTAAPVIEKAEKKVIKCKFDTFEKAQTEISAKLKIVSIIFIILGALGIVAYVVTAMLSDDDTLYPKILLFLGAILLVLGILYRSVVSQRLKAARNNAALTNVYEFYSDCLVSYSVRGNEKIGIGKTHYDTIVKYRETAHYLLIYISKAAAYAIPKEGISEEEYDTIMHLLSRPAKYGHAPIWLSACKEELKIG